MTSLTSAKRNADFILSEAPGKRSRDAGLLLNPDLCEPGDILKLVAATSDIPAHYQKIAKTEGSSIKAIAIYHAVTASGEDAEIAILTGDAEVNGNQLLYPAGADLTQTAAILAGLAAIGIKVR